MFNKRPGTITVEISRKVVVAAVRSKLSGVVLSKEQARKERAMLW
jgi:hypothetical protein